MSIKKIFSSRVIGTIFIVIGLANSAIANECKLGQRNCPLPPKEQLEIPVAEKHGNEYICRFLSVEKNHKISISITANGDFTYGDPQQEYAVDEKGMLYPIAMDYLIVKGVFTKIDGEGKIIITNTSNYAGEASCRKTC